MELLDTILRTCKAGDYVENFVQNDIDLYSLQLLNDDDLKIIGIKDANVRENILKKAKDLQIPLEKKININLDKDYILQVLYQIKNQLHLNNINLLYGLARDDIIICNNRFYPAALTLENCLDDLEKTLDDTKKKVCVNQKKNKSNRKTLILLASSTLLLAICGKFYFSTTKC